MILLNGKKYYVSSAYVTSKKPASAGAVQTTSQTAAGAQTSGGTAIALSSNYKYANYSKINSGTATLYRSTASNKKIKWSVSMPDMEQTVAEASRPSVIRMGVRK